MTKSAAKACSKVYLIFYKNIPKNDDHLYRQHSDFKSMSSGIVKLLARCVCVRVRICVCVCVSIPQYIYTQCIYKYTYKTSINLSRLHLKTFDFM